MGKKRKEFRNLRILGRRKESTRELQNLSILEFCGTEKRAKEGTLKPQGSRVSWKEERKQRKSTSEHRGSGVPKKERKKGKEGTSEPWGSRAMEKERERNFRTSRFWSFRKEEGGKEKAGLSKGTSEPLGSRVPGKEEKAKGTLEPQGFRVLGNKRGGERKGGTSEP